MLNTRKSILCPGKYSQVYRGSVKMYFTKVAVFPRVYSRTANCLSSEKSSRWKTFDISRESGLLCCVDLDPCLTKQKPDIFGKGSRRNWRKVTMGT